MKNAPPKLFTLDFSLWTSHARGERGSVIIYALLTMSVMLAIGLTLNSLFISKLKSAAQARNSIAALYAADSATELCLYDARAKASDTMTLSNGAAFKIVSTAPGQPDVTAGCMTLGTASFGFRATGTFRGVSRTLEISQ